MSMNITKEEAEGILKTAQAAQNKAKTLKEHGQALIGAVAQTGVIAGTSFGFGYLAGRKGDVRFMKVPVALGSAAVFHIGGFFGVFGKHSEIAHNMGDGALASYMTILGVQIGTEHKAAAEKSSGAQLPAAASTSGWAAMGGFVGNAMGMGPANQAGLMTTEELEALRMVRAA